MFNADHHTATVSGVPQQIPLDSNCNTSPEILRLDGFRLEAGANAAVQKTPVVVVGDVAAIVHTGNQILQRVPRRVFIFVQVNRQQIL